MTEQTTVECYTDTHHDSHINAVIDHNGTAYCIDHAVQVLFDGDIEAFGAVENGTDISFKDKHGNPFSLETEFSIQFESFPSEYYPKGLYCEFKDSDGEECHAELIAPQDEYDDDEFDPENTDEDF